MDTSTPVIRTYDLTKRFKRLTAVDEVNFEVNQGEVFGFLGPNGAGKTTTIAMLLGLVRPTAGSAEILGHDIRRSGIDNLRVFARIDGGDTEKSIPTILEQVGLEGRGKDKVGTYSQGMRQRLGLGAALLGDPELLILDEPTNGLDPAGMQEMRILIRRLADEKRKTVFLSSHLLHEVEQVCDRVLILNKGQIIAQGEVKALLSQAHALELRIEDVELAAEVVSKLDWVQGTTHEGDWLRIQVSPERAPELLAALAAHSLFPFEVRPVVSTLESVFLDLTNESVEGMDA